MRITKMFNNTTGDVSSTPYYDYDRFMIETQKKNTSLNTIRMLYITGYLIICTLGLFLNPLVIIAGSFYQRNSHTARWVLALAVTHLICSAFLPLQVLYSWYHFNWHYGTTLCKVSSYVFYASLFSTAGILTLWSIIDNNVGNKCEGKCCTLFTYSFLIQIMILGSWTFAVILSIPSLYSRELQYTNDGLQCVDDYDFNDEKTTSDGKRILTLVACYRFLLGILIPALLIGICCCCQSHGMKSNLKRITCLIKLAYFICWTPLLLIGFLQAVTNDIDNSSYALPVSTVLAAAHCCVNPVIYFLVGHDVKLQWMNQAQESCGVI